MAAEASFVVEGADPASAIPFDLHPGSKVKVASLLKEFDAGQIKYEKRPGVYVVMEEGPDGLSLAQFTPSSTVTIRITPSQGGWRAHQAHFCRLLMRSLHCKLVGHVGCLVV